MSLPCGWARHSRAKVRLELRASAPFHRRESRSTARLSDTISTSNIFRAIRNRKPSRQAVGPLDNQGAKGTLKEDKAVAEKLNELFASICTAEHVREFPHTRAICLG